MKILCTFPGKIGDILWSLPTVRAISRHFNTPVDFAITPEFDKAGAGLLKLIAEQEYIANAYALPGWQVEYKECIQPREPEVAEYDMVIHLGYDGWPSCELAKYTHDTALKQVRALDPKLDMSPWIAPVEPWSRPYPSVALIFVGWNQEWLELKMGLIVALCKSLASHNVCFGIPYGKGMRHEEWTRLNQFDRGGASVEMRVRDLYGTAKMLTGADFYLGDLSAQWVLANAMGKPCIVMEPSEARWNPIFWWDGEGRNKMVLGGDGKPTFDARHVRDAVLEQLKEIR